MRHESSKAQSQEGISAATAPPAKRLRASGPILILAVLFVLGAFLSWYFSWFGRDLSDADIASYLVDQQKPRHVQHALLQVQQRIESGDPGASKWYPQVIQLAASPEREFRLTVAWLMGFDNRSVEFHQALLQLVRDPEPIVRRNAALALVRFNDKTGRAELRAILEPYQLLAPASGVVASSLKEGVPLARGTLVVRLTQPGNATVEVRSPLPGKLDKIIAQAGTNVSAGTPLLTINSDEDSIWEALRGLALVGEMEDLPVVDLFARGSGSTAARIQQQAAQTANAIKGRANSQPKEIKQ
ncbi:MAG TPA: HEAT repeat domain-containing protein [Pyrinomonadaceae bacterium]|nr:HEAT repeat domain-containing protein [Pyrinomonadaceae bacterium]